MSALGWAVRGLGVGLVVATACSRSSSGSAETALVVGVQSDDLQGLALMEHIVTQVNGKMVTDTLYAPDGLTVGFPPTWEKKVFPPPGNDTGQLDVAVGAFDGPARLAPEVIKRLATTQFVPGQTLLLRIHIEARCIMYPGPEGPTDAGPGPLSGPLCTSPLSCIDGKCQDGIVPSNQLEPYRPDWPTHPPDQCKPPDAGTPDLQAGVGESDFAPVTDGQTVQVVKGPQGGHHIWIALRQRNLTQMGSTTVLSAVAPATGVEVPASGFPFVFDPDQGGYCKLYGLRYQLDTDGLDYSQFLGQRLDLTYKVTDSTGASSSTTVHVNVAPTVITQ